MLMTVAVVSLVNMLAPDADLKTLVEWILAAK